MIQYDTVWYDMILYDMIRYDTIRYDTIRYDTIRYDTIWHNMIQHDTLLLSPRGNLRWTPMTHLAALTAESINRNSKTNNPHIKKVHISKNHKPNTPYIAPYPYKTQHKWTEHHYIIAQPIQPQEIWFKILTEVGTNEFLKQFSLHWGTQYRLPDGKSSRSEWSICDRSDKTLLHPGRSKTTIQAVSQ